MREFLVNIHRHRVVGELMGVNQSAGELVVGVCGQAIVHEESRFGVEGFRVSLDQAIDLRTRRFRSGDCVSPGQSGNVLPKGMAGDEAVKVVALQAETGEVVPASHVLSGSGQSGNLPKDLEQSIVVEVEKASVVLFELAVHGAVEQLHLRIGKGGKRSVDCDRTSIRPSAQGGRIFESPGGKRASRVSGCGGSGGGSEKSSAADTAGHRCLLKR